MKPYNYGMACAAFLEPGDSVIAGNRLATVYSKVSNGSGPITLTFEAQTIADEVEEGYPMGREKFSEIVERDHKYPYLFWLPENATFTVPFGDDEYDWGCDITNAEA